MSNVVHVLLFTELVEMVGCSNLLMLLLLLLLKLLLLLLAL